MPPTPIILISWDVSSVTDKSAISYGASAKTNDTFHYETSPLYTSKKHGSYIARVPVRKVLIQVCPNMIKIKHDKNDPIRNPYP
jgi:hypothetical protein